MDDVSVEDRYAAANPDRLVNATLADLLPDPNKDSSWTSGSIETSLNFIGRSHGTKKLGSVAGPTDPIGGWDLRTSNFLYLDGHVETKNVAQTVGPLTEWADRSRRPRPLTAPRRLGPRRRDQ